MSAIPMTTLFYKALILQGEIWCWSHLGLRGLRERMKSCLTQGSSGRGRIDPFYPGTTFLHIMGLKKLKQIHEEWDCVTSCNQVSWIDHGRLYETEQQSAVFKLSYVQTMLYKTCTGAFLKRFFNASVRISLRKLKHKAICFSLIWFVLVFPKSALKTVSRFCHFRLHMRHPRRYLLTLTLNRVVWTKRISGWASKGKKAYITCTWDTPEGIW